MQSNVVIIPGRYKRTPFLHKSGTPQGRKVSPRIGIFYPASRLTRIGDVEDGCRIDYYPILTSSLAGTAKFPTQAVPIPPLTLRLYHAIMLPVTAS
jgi:hypothetical protein